MRTLGLIHTVAGLAPVFAELVGELLPETTTVVIADELLLKRTVRDGAIDAFTRERLRAHVTALGDFGVDAVLVTCSSVGDAVDEVARDAGVPVLRVDAAMADRAVSLGSRIGVLATLPTTLGPTAALVERAARAAGAPVVVVPRLAAGAFDALGRGDGARHDELVAAELERLTREVDVVVLAQASMARIAATLPPTTTPILSSPRLAVERIAAGEDGGE